MLTKPLTRAGFIAAKTVAGLALLLAATAIGSALCVLTTMLVFDASLIADFVASVALWLALAAMFTTLMVLLSAALDRQAPAAGIGIGVYVAVVLLTGFPLVRDRSPAGLMAANDAVIRGRDVALAWPLLTTLALAALFAVVAVAVFRRKEL
jgi:ABC-2 type transport system permease protein